MEARGSDCDAESISLSPNHAQPNDQDEEESRKHGFESFVNGMALKLKECVKTEVAVLLRQQEITDYIPDKKAMTEPSVAAKKINEETKQLDYSRRVEDRNPGSQTLADEKKPIPAPPATITEKNDETKKSDYFTKVDIEDPSFQAFSNEMVSKVEEIVRNQMIAMSKQSQHEKIAKPQGEKKIPAIPPVTIRGDNWDINETEFFKNENQGFQILLDEKKPMTQFPVQIREANSESNELDFFKKVDSQSVDFQTFTNEVVMKVEEIIRNELTTLSKQEEHDVITNVPNVNKPRTIPFVTISNKGKEDNSKKQVARKKLGKDLEFETFFVNRLVQKIERSVKCELIVLSTQQNIIPTILKRLQNIDEEINGVKEDVMTLYSCTTCVNDANFKLRDGKLQNGVGAVKRKLGKLNSAVHDIILTMNEMSSE